jgi:hypothetical protein
MRLIVWDQVVSAKPKRNRRAGKHRPVFLRATSLPVRQLCEFSMRSAIPKPTFASYPREPLSFTPMGLHRE